MQRAQSFLKNRKHATKKGTVCALDTLILSDDKSNEKITNAEADADLVELRTTLR